MMRLQQTAEKLVDTVLKKYRENENKVLIVGISGAPGTGKSTIAKIIVEKLNTAGANAEYCPMDGFHFSNKELKEMNLSSVKGRIDTFDVEYFNISIAKLKSGKKPFYWPTYCRKIHDPVIEGVSITEEMKIFIIEGNYIFYKCDGWNKINDCFDLKIFLTADENIIKDRLLKRHLAGGKSYDIAVEKVENVDIPNAHEILKSQLEADIVIDAGGLNSMF